MTAALSTIERQECMSATMNINGHEFNVTGGVKSKTRQVVPMLDIPMMSDETWNRYVIEGARKHFTEAFDREPINDEEALGNDTKSVRILSARRVEKARA